FESGSFSRAFRPLRSSFDRPPGRALRHDRSCPGFAPHRDVTGGIHTRCRAPFPSTWDFQAPLCSVLRFSQPLDGLLCHRLRGLVSSRCHVQGFPVQGVLSIRSGYDSSPHPASVSFPTRVLTGKPAATRTTPDSEALLHEPTRSA